MKPVSNARLLQYAYDQGIRGVARREHGRVRYVVGWYVNGKRVPARWLKHLANSTYIGEYIRPVTFDRDDGRSWTAECLTLRDALITWLSEHEHT